PFCHPAPPTSDASTLSLHDALPICDVGLLLGVASLDRKALQQLIQHLLELRFGSRRRQIGDRLALEDRVDSRNRADLKLRRNELDRKSTRLNSSHVKISYAVFCLKK